MLYNQRQFIERTYFPVNNRRRPRMNRQAISLLSTSTILHSQQPERRIIRETIGSHSSEAELSGLREVLNKNLPIWTRLFWLAIFVVAVMICSYQSALIIKNLVDDPSVTIVRYKRNEAIEFPSIVVCPGDRDVKYPIINPALLKERFGNATTENVQNLLKLGTLTLSELWNLYKLNITDITVETSDHSEELASRNNGIMESAIINEVYTSFGTCIHMRLINNLRMYQSGTFLKLTLSGEWAFAMVAVHQSDSLPLEKYLYHRTGVLVEGCDREKYFLRLTQMRNRNTRKRPCRTGETVSNCLSKCLVNKFSATETKRLCRLPFMNIFDDIAPCSTKADMETMISAIYNATEAFEPGLCYCPRKCSEIMYVIDSRKKMQNEPFGVEIHVAEVWMTFVEEVAAYNAYKAFSDLGGVIGLWLGICLLEIIEFFTSCFTQLLLKCKRKLRPLNNNNGKRFRIVVAKNVQLNKKNSPVSDYPGINRVFKEGSSLPARTLWLTVFMITTAMCINQCVQQTVYYFSDPSKTNIFYTTNETIAFPVVTICPKSSDGLLPAVNPHIIKEMFGQSNISIVELIKNRRMTIDEIWNASSLRISKKFSEARQKNWHLRMVSTIIGNCHSFSPDNIPKYTGLKTNQYLKILTDTGIKLIIVHEAEDLPLIQYLAQSYGTESVNPHFGWSSRRTFRITQLSYRNTRKSPCQDRYQVVECLVKCLKKAVTAEITQGLCRLPYMDEADRSVPVCESEKELHTMLNATLSAVQTFHQEDCLCTEICRQLVYSTEFLHEKVLMTPGGLLIVELGVRDNRIMIVEESSSYTGVALFADIGGTFGLFTGLCILNMFEIIKSVYCNIKCVIKRMFCYNCKKKDSNIPTVITDINSTASLATGYCNVTIPGFAFSTDKKSPLWVQSVWIIISAGASILCGYQFLERLQYYLSDPTEVRMHYSNNKSITFPLTLICPFQRNSIYTLNDDGIHFRDYWNVSRLQVSKIWISINEEVQVPLLLEPSNHHSGHDSPRNASASITIEATAAGICFLTKINGQVTYKGYRTSVDVTVFERRPKGVWMAYFHSYDKRIISYISPKQTFVGSNTKAAKISLEITEVLHRNTHQNPCVNGEISAVCITNCLETQIFARVNTKCRLPFMKESGVYPLCRTRKEYLALKNASYTVLGAFERKQCNCPRNCKETIYSLEEANIESGPLSMVNLKVHVPENRIAIIQEETAYGFVRLLSDIGGSLGLFFGIGLLQILELVTASLSKLRKQLKITDRNHRNRSGQIV